METNILSISGQETGKKVNLSDTIFSIEPNDHAIYLDVKQSMANHRQGTHKSKEKWEVSGSTRKLKKQKGTGTARSGSIKSPVFPGGARVFGPRPRDYSFKLNKKVKILARKSALTYKAKENNILVIEDFQIEKPKTKEICTLLKNLNLSDKKSLLILNDQNENIFVSGRNLQDFQVISVKELNTYNIVDAQKLIFVESSVSTLETLFKVN